ncbi:hypothetical protein CAPTEDRAFT_191584 [Capitella teleta]|uniref:Ig-like domain-containing protein n=1 Tax=Capitella teleta TaxID=283909 RepID=R7T9W8_CAPTE|nr:hypothetical protein CAPTEDRAFT_191584 [Capitella teleta]|eukprot:ELT90504.1 hypothetical protein CAPTEDRAFT_191584 [Capitella teleta]
MDIKLEMCVLLAVSALTYGQNRDPPGGSTIEGNSSVIEGSKVTLACIADYLGDPEGEFYWNSPSGATHVGKTLLIRNATVDSDDGEYQCFVENFAKGEFGNHTLTVNAVPRVERNPPAEKTILNTDDSFSITTATLRWSGVDTDVRKLHGGKMFCEADNGLVGRPVQSLTMDLRVTTELKSFLAEFLAIVVVSVVLLAIICAAAITIYFTTQRSKKKRIIDSSPTIQGTSSEIDTKQSKEDNIDNGFVTNECRTNATKNVSSSEEEEVNEYL